jgi:DNA primase large subunit
MPYSLHEKSELVSIPIKKENVLSFDKERAKPENVKTEINFLDRNVQEGEATEILQKAIEIEEKEATNKRFQEKMFSSDKKSFDEYEIDQEAIPEEFFPPCIKNCHKGLEDGRKRVLFMLTNFLNSMNWSFDKIDDYLHKWNKTNEEELRENAIKTQLQYRKKRKKILPPNCDTQGYYKDLRICTPDDFCARIKNPAQYAKLKAKLNKKKRKKKNKKKEEKNAKNKN